MMEKIKVFIVDDHALVRDGIRALLSMIKDIEITGEAVNGKEAVDQIEELVPDVILMDLSMPIMGGLEATRRICRELSQKAKILVLSQYDDNEFVLPVIQAGAKGFVTKNSAFSELANAIHAVSRGESYLSPSAAASLVEKYQHRIDREEEIEPYDLLTDRERDVLKLLAEGYTAREIAGMLFISSKTVEWHKASLMNKLKLRNKTELIKFALRKSIISL